MGGAGIVVTIEDPTLAADQRVQAIAGNAADLCRRALESVRRRVGLEMRDAGPLSVRLVSESTVEDGIAADAFVEFHASRPVPRIRVAVEKVLRGDIDLQTQIHHECVHVIEFEQLGFGSYCTPGWLSEGMADWCEGELEPQLAEAYRTTSWGTEFGADWCLRLSLASTERHWDHLRGCLVFLYLVDSRGESAALGLARNVMAHEDWKAALRLVTGQSVGEFERDFKLWARARIARDTQGREEVAAAVRAFRTDREPQVMVRALEGFLARNPSSPYVPSARLDLVAALVNAGEFARARVVLAECEREPSTSVGARRFAFLSLVLGLKVGDQVTIRRWVPVFNDRVLNYVGHAECNDAFLDELRRY